MKTSAIVRLAAIAPDDTAPFAPDTPPEPGIDPALASVDALIAFTAQAMGQADCKQQSGAAPVAHGIGAATDAGVAATARQQAAAGASKPQSASSAPAPASRTPGAAAPSTAPASPMRSSRGKGGAVRAIDDGDDADLALIDQMTVRLTTDLIAMPAPRGRGRGRRGNRVGAVGDINSAAGGALIDDDDDNPDDAEAVRAAMPPPPALHVPLQPERPSIAVLDLALPPLEQWAAQAASDGFARAVHPAAPGLPAPVAAAPAEPAQAEGRHGQGRQGQAGDEEQPTAAAEPAADHGARREAGGPGRPGSPDADADSGRFDFGDSAVQWTVFFPPLMNRRLETNGVDDALILLCAAYRHPGQLRRSPMAIPAVSAVMNIAPQAALLREPGPGAIDRRPRHPHADRRSARRPRGLDRAVAAAADSRLQAAARCRATGPHGAQPAAARRLLMSDPRSAGAVECDDGWASGYAMPAAASDPPACVPAHPARKTVPGPRR